MNYTLDLNAGLTQVIDDGTNVYTYGLGRISQTNNSTAEYFLGDALGSVRQLANGNAEITLSKSYDPYGEVLSSAGSGSSAFAYTGEQQDASGLTYLRSRYYSPLEGRPLSRDTWEGSYNSPQSLNRWNYTQSNPINYTDPSGNCTFAVVDTILCAMILAGTLSGLAGAVFAFIVAERTWQFAFEGKCSCTDTTNILVYSKSQFVARATLAGAGLGVLFGIIAGTGNAGTAGVALAGVIMTAPGIKPALDKYKASNYQDKCALVELMSLTIGLGASVFGGLVAFARAPISGFFGIRGATAEKIISKIPSNWIKEFDYYKPPSDPTQSIAQYKFTSPDGWFEIRIHAPQKGPGFETTWVARIGIQVPKGTPLALPNKMAAGEYWLYFTNEGIPTNSQPLMHIPLNTTLADMIRVFGFGYYLPP